MRGTASVFDAIATTVGQDSALWLTCDSPALDLTLTQHYRARLAAIAPRTVAERMRDSVHAKS